MMHVHISALSAVVVALYVIVFGFLWRILSAHWSENNLGKAMSFIY